MKKRPQIQSDWALYNCISQKGSTVPNSQELGSLLEILLFYTLTIFNLLSVLTVLKYSISLESWESVTHLSWKIPHKNLVFCFAHRNAKSFPRPSSLL